MRIKYLLFLLAAICFTFSAIKYFRRSEKNQEHLAEIKSTTIRFSKSLIDVGERKLHSKVTASFVVYNTGSNDLYIQNVLPDCHCTVASFSGKPIVPNDSSVISLKYDASQLGVFQSSSVVTTNTPDPNTLLVFRGSIEP
jgi:hypothetical protein